jgi:hypothetical protein
MLEAADSGAWAQAYRLPIYDGAGWAGWAGWLDGVGGMHTIRGACGQMLEVEKS